MNPANWTARRKMGTRSARDEARYQEWLCSQPGRVHEIARRWPPGIYFQTPDGILHVVGYGETDTEEIMLILSPIDPSQDYDRACKEMIRVCAAHLNDIQIQP